MKKHERAVQAATVASHIEKHRALLDECMRDLAAAEASDIPVLGKTPRAAVLLAGLLENYYTCAESVFVRISQFFENHLSQDRWHRDLLERMTLEIEDARPRLLSDPVYRDLLELMRFRHFKRYYFGTAYDWDRLEELLRRVKRSHSPLMKEFVEFLAFLKSLAE